MSSIHTPSRHLSDPDRTRLVLVARLQKSTLQEVARTHDELAAIGLKNQYLVINGVLPETEAVNDTAWRLQYGAGSRRRWQVFPLVWDALTTDTLFLQPVNMVGVSALRGLLTSQPETASFAEVSALQKPAISSLSALVDEIAP
ncbi:arsenical pump-driving ATPase [Klebsiella michiganensis]|uniref:Arsenical pump-driving ATPase n=1 Tax=Klebsiella michiganensis TaxID=1134687 RepID=A0A7H4N8W4_9ENTR|nr:arsenical pump-driving ATPase [Klebsiella michiganensis]